MESPALDAGALAGRGLRSVPSSLPAGVDALDLSGNPLGSLRGLERVAPGLAHLVLDGCSLADAQLAHLPPLPRLTTLSLNKNQLSELEPLLSRLRETAPRLAFLSLLGNPACPHRLSDPDADDADYERWRLYVVSWLPALRFLDSSAVTAAERRDAADRGRLLRVARPANSARTTKLQEQPEAEESCTPLPKTGRLPGDHRAAYGRCRYRYSGKQSEGNRFISNSDL